ncbi:MAG: hypothetical protein LKE29_10885 [Acidaminococcaceae bacterium]|jgi:hypothetical protein|nr:hypothetical protein [Acidaminococcaceae bacterium]
MRKFFIALCLLVLGSVMMGAAPSISSYNDKVVLNADNSAQVVSEITMDSVPSGSTYIPLNIYKKNKNIEYSGIPKDIIVEQHCGTEDIPYLELKSNKLLPEKLNFTVKYQAAAVKQAASKKVIVSNSNTYNYRFVNAGETPIKKYSLSVFLPQGYELHSVKGKTPAGKGANAAKTNYVNKNGHNGIVVSGINVRPGDVVGAKFITVPQGKSRMGMVVLTIIGILYLIEFKGIVKSK